MGMWSFGKKPAAGARRSGRSTTFRPRLETLEGREVPSASITDTVTPNDSSAATTTTPPAPTAAPANPTATFSNSGPVLQNQAVTFFFTNPSDPTFSNDLAGFTYAFDFGNGSFSNSPQTVVSSATHTFAQPGTYTVYGRIYDKTGAFTQYSTTVTVNGDGIYAVGAGPGSAPEVKVYDAITHQLKHDFMAYDPNFAGGVNVAVGDVNGDGVPDIITGASAGGGPNVKVFDGNTGKLIASFFAYDPNFTGGVNVAVGDVNGDGHADIITGAGPGGGPHVKVINGTQINNVGADGQISNSALLYSFFAYDANFTGGVSVAAGDLNGDGHADIVTGAGPGGGPDVKVVNGASGAVMESFMAFSPTYGGGVDVAVGNLLQTGADIIVGQMNGASAQIHVFNGSNLNLLSSFSPFASTNSPSAHARLEFTGQFANGVHVGTVDDGAGHDDLIVGVGGNFVSQVNIYSNLLTLLGAFEAFDPTVIGGVSVG
ncbi:MAG TPA: FG-GAP-like repeat-containing protein [Gemmataceae bacterium]|nr:FG-GAP-like repeat-containing protein [Gemmataceae bacterium]